MNLLPFSPLSSTITGNKIFAGGGSPPPFAPDSLSSLLQWSLEGEPYYEAGLLNGIEVLTSLEPYDSPRAPRQGRGYLFDGVDDKCQTPVSFNGATEFTIWRRAMYVTQVGAYELDGLYASSQIRLGRSGTAFWAEVNGQTFNSGVAPVNGQWHTLAFACKAGDTNKLYYNNTQIHSAAATWTSINNPTVGYEFAFGAHNFNGNHSWYSNYEVSEYRLYNRQLTVAELTYLETNGASGTDPGLTNLLAKYDCNEEAGKTAFDSSGNNRHGRLLGPIVESTFHSTDNSIFKNPANQTGFAHGLKISGANYNSQWIGKNAAPGDFVLEMRFPLNNNVVAGMQSETTSTVNSYVQVDIGIQTQVSLTNIVLWRNGATTTHTVPAVTTSDIFEISRIGSTVSIKQNGTTITTFTNTSTLYPVATTTGSEIELIYYSGGLDTLLDTGMTVNNLIIPSNGAIPSQDVFGNPLQYEGKCPYPARIDPPCITGDGSAVEADLGFRLVPLSGDWSLTLDVFLPSSTPSGFSGFIGQADGAWASAWLVYYDSGWKCSYGNYLSHAVGFDPTLNAWNNITFNKVGTTMTITCNGKVTSGTCASTISITNNTMLLSNRFARVIASISNVSCTADGVTTYVPCQEGDGRHLYYVSSDGLGFGVVADAIVNGTVSTIRGTRRNTIGKDWSVQYGGTVTQNLVKYSEEFQNAYWTKSNSNLSFGGSTGPFGAPSGNVAKLVSTTTPGYYFVTTTPTIDTTGGGTYSIYAKAAGYNWMYIDDGIGPRANFDLQNGVLGNVTAGSTATIESAGNGWYKCSLTTPGGASSYLRAFVGQANDNINFTGNGTDGIYISHAQLTTRPNQIYARTYGDIRDKQFVPGKLTGGVDATGSALTSVAGKFGNPFSRLNQNPFLAAELNGLNVQTAYEDLPCLSCNGSSIYASVPSSTLIGDFDFTGYFYTNNTYGGIWGNSSHGVYINTLTSMRFYVNGTLNQYICNLVVGVWYKLRVVRVGTTVDMYLDDRILTRNVTNSLGGNVPITLIGSGFNNFVFNGRLSNFQFTNAGVTTIYPLTDGSGSALTKFTDGVPSILASSVLGSTSLAWANKTDGSVVPASRFSQRAIITRETKFNRVSATGDDRFAIFKTALTGADLTNMDTYTT